MGQEGRPRRGPMFQVLEPGFMLIGAQRAAQEVVLLVFCFSWTHEYFS